ncbi:MAG: hypothetical protein Q9207_004934, partial [Kuettlingeria erythrocarpa]
MALVANTSTSTVDFLICTSVDSGFGDGQSQLTMILLQPEHNVHAAHVEAEDGVPYARGEIFASASISAPVSSSLGVP